MLRLKAERLAASRGDRRVFRGLDFEIAAGEALILTGPNGSGKSTLLRILAGFGDASAGAIHLSGGPPEKPLGECCHYVAHADALKTAFTAIENLTFWARYFGGGDPAKALDAIGISHLADIPAGLMSAGQKRRLGLARLKLAPRPVWLLDEPSVSLDSASQAQLENLLRGHVEGGGILVAATHLPLGIGGAAEIDLADYRAGGQAE